MGRRKCVSVILTFNSESIIRETISQASKVKADILVIDSGSTDKTLDIVKSFKSCLLLERDFKNYSDQRNWSILLSKDKYEWQLHLDADEVLDEISISDINSKLDYTDLDAFMIKRRDYFLGRMMRFSGLNPWHLRLFKSDYVRCEDRLYDQHFVSVKDCKVGGLKGFMHDKNALSISEWIARHNRWSSMEAQQIFTDYGHGENLLQPNFFGCARERTRFYKSLYYKLPRVIRAFFYFLYRYFFRLGFLDGIEGLYFSLLQGLWFRLLIDIKLGELNKEASR
jgi:glycosyltransferase involved in cell wall biosynthesis